MVSFDQMMAELRVEYLASIPQKIIDIQSHLAAKDFAQLREDFHKLKGTGRTYGIPEISELSEVLEKICLAATENNMSEFRINVTNSIPGAIKILAQVQNARQAQREFPVSNLPEFQAMKSLLK